MMTPPSSAIEPLPKSRKRGSKVLKAPVKADLHKHLADLDCRAATRDIDSERNVYHATHSRSLQTTFLLQLLQSSSTVSRVRGIAYQKVYTVRHVLYVHYTCMRNISKRSLPLLSCPRTYGITSFRRNMLECTHQYFRTVWIRSTCGGQMGTINWNGCE